MRVIRKHFATIDSTNTWAKQNGACLDPECITLITADEQTAGRGRFKRVWSSPKGLNIYATFCLFVDNDRQDIGNLPQIMALSAAEILEKKNFLPQIKWPNDLLISGKKTAGILCETTPLEFQRCVILGIGLNVNMPSDLLQKIDRPATSLFVESGKEQSREDILDLLEKRFVSNFAIFLKMGFSPFFEKYKFYLVHQKGEWIRFHDNRMVWEGSFEEITDDGALVLTLMSGEQKTFYAGEIII